MGPNGLRHIEQSLAAVSTAPLEDFVFGFVMRSVLGPTEAFADTTAINELV